MHSEALIKLHLFSYLAKSLDILRLNCEIAEMVGQSRNAQNGGGGYDDNAQKAERVQKVHKINVVHYLPPPLLCIP